MLRSQTRKTALVPPLGRNVDPDKEASMDESGDPGQPVVRNEVSGGDIDNLAQVGHVGTLNIHLPGYGGLLKLPRSLRIVSPHVNGFTRVVGREQLLAQITDMFDAAGRRHDLPVMVVLHGLAGIGKTSLARAYTQRSRDRYQIVLWMHGQDASALPGEFRSVLEVLAPESSVSVRDPVQVCHALLANFPGRWLLVLDNVADASGLAGTLPAAGQGDVLITSRIRYWQDSCNPISVPLLEHEDAVAVLTGLSGDEDEQSASRIAAELGWLPLALAQAGAFCGRRGLSLAEFLSLYHRDSARLLAEGGAPDYTASVATTWRLAFGALSARSQAALSLCIGFAPDAIPLAELVPPDAAALEECGLPASLLEHLTEILADGLAVRTRFAKLWECGLLTSATATSVGVHRLVQALTTDHLVAQGTARAWVRAGAILLSHACPSTYAHRGAIEQWLRLEPHVLAVIEHLEPDDPLRLRLRSRRAGWHGYLGGDIAARELLAELIDDYRRVLGDDHVETLQVRAHHAWWTGSAGNAAGAAALYENLISDHERVCGHDDERTFGIRDARARWTGEAGDAARAFEFYTVLVADMTKAFGRRAKATLSARTGLARWTGEIGEARTARAMYADLLVDVRENAGPTHKDTLYIRACLAWWTGESGEPAVACDLYRELVEDHEELLGEASRDTLGVRYGLGHWLGKSGNASAAREYFENLVEDHVRTQGPDHLDTRGVRKALEFWSATSSQPPTTDA